MNLALVLAIAALARGVPNAPWPLVAIAVGAALALAGRGSRGPLEPALTLGFAMVGLEVELDGLRELGPVVFVAPLLFWTFLVLGGELARRVRLFDLRGAGLCALGLSGSGLPPLLVAARRDARVSPNQTSVALLVVVASGALASLVLPPLAHVFGLVGADAGLWLGVVVSQTTGARASAALFSPEAVAVVASTKLVLLLAQGLPVSTYLAATRSFGGAGGSVRRDVFALAQTLVPRHAVAFVAAACCASFMDLEPAVLDLTGFVVTVCFAHLLVGAGRDLGARGRSSWPWGAVLAGVAVWFVSATALAAILAVSSAKRQTIEPDQRVAIVEMERVATSTSSTARTNDALQGEHSVPMPATLLRTLRP